MNKQTVINFLLAAGLLACLLQVWLPGWFLTGDGPCHVENAQIFHDLLTNKNTALYSRFYDVIYQPNPNWFTSIIIALLLCVVKGVVAEKMFISLYVLLFTGGFYLLLRKISNGRSWWLPALFIFVFTHALSKGFYNFSFSIAFYFWVVWAWLRFLDKRGIANALLFIFLTSLIFFTHLLSFVFAAFTCGALIVSYALASAEKNRRMAFFFRSAAFLVLFIAPFLILMRWFTEKEGGMGIQLGHHFGRIKDLFVFRYIVSMSSGEVVFAGIAGVLILALCICALISLSNFKIHKYDGFIAALLFVSFVYFFFPEEFLGRMILISLRVQLMVMILAACIIAYRLKDGNIKNAAGIMLFACFLSLTIVRTSCLMTASRAVADISSCAAYIKPSSVVLPLCFSPDGKDEHGKVITDKNWIFNHVAQYLGADKPLIVLDNYEANAGYFPLVWKQEVNPYYRLGKAGSFENHPPSADIEDYRLKTGVSVDYVLMWCFDSSALKDEGFGKLYAQINAGYSKVYTSASGRTVLFEKK